MLPSYFLAINFRCHPSSVSGVTMVATWLSNLRPSLFALAASRRRWSSVKRIRRLPNLFSEVAIFFNQVVDDMLLMLVHPASERDYEKGERLEHRMHCCRLSCKV